ncbi:hypothetical protein FRC0431_01827 [Corynebacterium diphtheriae]|nr:hypothetical protein FRC0431_01827 [Corynebacterium diphtheriae]
MINLNQALFAVASAPETASLEYDLLLNAMRKYETFADLFTTQEAPVIAQNPPKSEVASYIHHCFDAKRKAFAALSQEQQDRIAPFVTKCLSPEWEEELIAAIDSSVSTQ